MAGGPDIVTVPGIATLPPTTARQIGSGQVLVDPSSVVKELIDNALDARAKSIFVDIAANTIDSIQVKDDGHGIPTEDRSLVCRRSCTSKIRDFHDLREVGGKWLGFRGEALSSMAEMSSSLCVTTRVEGEPAAVKLKYGRDGELASVEYDSHPVGTTVKVTKFFELIPVRKQTARKNSAKLLAKLRRLMQAYALARPTIRFRLRVLKAKNNNGDFVYAPKTDANIEDAALKVIGKDCALQCDLTVLEADGFEVHAFLPKPGATGSKIAHQGAFVSIDARPVSSSRGTTNQIIRAYKDRLRKSNPSFAGVKDPFFCLNIICPPDSYDPNIEPAKDDIMFNNSDIVIGVVDKLLKAYYPEAVQEVHQAEPPNSAQQQYGALPEQLPSRVESPTMVHENEPTSPIEESPTNLTQALPRWRSSMYGIDEDDLQFLQQEHAPVIEEEEGLRAAQISNPWTIARMNATIKPKQALSNGQLLSPAKSQGGGNSHFSSPSPAVTPHRPRPVFPLTPQTSSRTNIARSPSDVELERSIQHVPQLSSETGSSGESTQDSTTNVQRRYEFSTSSLHTGMSNHFKQPDIHPTDSPLSSFSQSNTSPQGIVPSVHSALRSRRAPQAYAGKPFAPSTRVSCNAGSRTSLAGVQSFQPARHQHAAMNQGPRLPANTLSAPRRPILNAAEHTVPNQLYLNDNSDIRDFFGRSRDVQAAGSSITSINSGVGIHQLRGRPPPFSDNAPQLYPHGQRNVLADSHSRALSAEPQPRAKGTRDHLLFDDDRVMNTDPRNTAQQSQGFAQQQGSPRASSAGIQMSMSFDQRSAGIRDSLSIHDEDGTRLELRNALRQLQTHHDPFPQSPTPKSSSLGSECRFVSQRVSQVAVPLNTHHLDQSAKEMEAYFRSQQQQHSSSPAHPQNSSQRHEPRIAPPHEISSETRRPRRRTTDTLERTTSSKLPLERTPKGSHIQNFILLLPTSIHTIMQCSRKLDMRRNSPEWGYPCGDAYNVFAEPVFEKKIMKWVVKLDAMLCQLYEKNGGVDTRCEIHEGIQRALDARKEVNDAVPEVEGMDYDIVSSAVGPVEHDILEEGGDATDVVVRQPAVEAERTVRDDEEFDFDMGQFVDLTAEDEGQIMKTAGEGSVEAVKGEYDEDIEDEMLMDL
ncbi:uncharacterized protein ALTATR162_LOCUS7529 [Alternaria atra]|uniref:DNA mismatch repair protein S5 domain-containing protein n=1 Tax=Alternaria atra TaxID=119953 RepID=A0A8J2IDW4_9PLEO|nr:uncharacterized protein ALTATR162_LOCUS7529 [Alternaria atra]CAG5172809.1 unnamed protein product [Alternaria atra]